MDLNQVNDIISNRYRIIAELGRGGMGIVYKVEDILKDNMLFALKTIKKEILYKYAGIGTKSFKNEYEIMTRLKHPNLARVYDFGLYQDNYYIIIEYLKGKLLNHYWFKSFNEKIDILVHILRALEYIHSRNIIYRDLKPGNIMISDNGVKLLDFGLAGFEDNKDAKIKGTLPYLPPEILQKNIGYNLDIFSLGILFYEMLTNCRFYYSSPTILRNILALLKSKNDFENHRQERLKKIKRKELREIISKMTEFDAQERPDNCASIINMINERLNCQYEYETEHTRSSYVLGNAFANRNKEFAMLIKNKSHRIVLFSGPMGIGKTRLFTEYKKYCRINDILFFDTSCREGDLGKYQSFQEIISQMISHSEQSLLKQFGKYINLLLQEKSISKDHKPPEILDARILQDIIVQNITDFILKWTKTRKKEQVIIYFNDIQWIDEGSEKILENLLNRAIINKEIRSLFIYGNINENKLSKECRIIDILSSFNSYEKYDLLPLDTDGVYEYINNVFGRSFVDESLKAAVKGIKDKVGGNPLYLEEYLTSLIENGIINKDKKNWKLIRSIDDVKIPQNIVDIINIKLDNLFLNENYRKILKILSLLRIHINIDALKAIIERIAELDTAKVLQGLENLEVLHAFNVQDRVYYSYSSSLIKDLICEKIDNKSEIRVFLAETLSLINEKSTDDLTEEIAFQYFLGGDFENAVKYFEKCGDNAQKDYFNEKAIQYFAIILKLMNKHNLSGLESEIRIKLKMGRVYDHIGKRKESGELYGFCLDSAKMLSNQHLIAESYQRIGFLKFSSGDFKEALKFYGYAKEIFEKLKDRHSLADLTVKMGHVFFRLGENQKSLECYKTKETISKESDDKHGIAIAMGNMGNVFFRMGEFIKALECFETDKKISAELGDIRAIGITCLNMGNIYIVMGEYEKGLQIYKKSEKIAQNIGDKQVLATVSGNMGLAYRYLGEFNNAIKCHKAHKKISEQIGDRAGYAMAIGNIGLVYMSLKHYSKALKCLKQYEKISTETGDKQGMANAYGNIGLVYLNKWQYHKCLKIFLKQLKITSEIGDKKGYAIANLNIGNLYYILGEFPKALIYLNCSIRVFTEIGMKKELANTYNTLGNVYYALKDTDKSQKAIEKAIELYKTQNIYLIGFIECLITLSKIYIIRNLPEKAMEYANMAFETSKENNLSDEIMSAEIQKYRVYALYDTSKAIKLLSLLLAKISDDERKAEVFYELYKLTKNEDYKSSYIRIYELLYRNNPKYFYKAKCSNNDHDIFIIDTIREE